jgi:hypothetical protein
MYKISVHFDSHQERSLVYMEASKLPDIVRVNSKDLLNVTVI